MRAAFGGSLLLAGCSYEAPVDPQGAPILGALSGTVVYGGEGEPNHTYVNLYASNNPGPPAGTGRPLTFASVPASAYTQEDAGLVSADFALTRIPTGRYLLAALVDQDGDFSPFASALAGATCGDWGGAHLESLADQRPAEVAVSGGRLVDDLTILVGAPFTTERPAFQLRAAALSLGDILGGAQQPLFRVQSTPIYTAFSKELPLVLEAGCEPEPALPGCTELPACPCAAATMPPCASALWLWVADADGDGVADPYPAQAQADKGLLDIWPRVYLEYAGELGTFDHEGETLPERWVAEAFPLAGEIAVTAQQAQVPPGEVPPLLGLTVGVPTALHDLSVTFAPVFRHYHAAGEDGEDVNGPFDLVDLTAGDSPEDVPAGGWAVTLVSHTGQTWTVPNEVGGLPSTEPELFPDPEAQGVPLMIEP